MTEAELIREFQTNRLHVVLAQLAPTGLWHLPRSQPRQLPRTAVGPFMPLRWFS